MDPMHVLVAKDLGNDRVKIIHPLEDGKDLLKYGIVEPRTM